MQPLPATADVLDWLTDWGDEDVRRRVSWICQNILDVVPHVDAIAIWFVDEDLALVFTQPQAAQSVLTEAVRSSLALTFASGRRVVAVVTVYSGTAGAFDGTAGIVERHVGAVEGRARVDDDLDFDMHARAIRAPAQLRARRDVDAAIGHLMGMDGLTLDQAERLLAAMAATSGRSTDAVAARIITVRGSDPGSD